MRALAALALVATLTLTACAESEPEVSEFVTSCRDALAGDFGDDEAATAACECAESTAEERMEEDAYAMFLISFLPDRNERADEVMAREGFSVDVEEFSMTMLEVMEDCGFGDVRAN